MGDVKKIPICYRYPQMFVCGCTIPCRSAMQEVTIDHVKDNLYVGPIQAAYDVEKLQNLNIKHIVDLSQTDYHRTPDKITYTIISVEDSVKADIFSHFEKAINIITEAQEKGENVLVHCQAGASRSVSVCMAYCIQKDKITVDQSLELLKQVHPRSQPNRSFLLQLQSFYEQITRNKPY